VSPVPDGAFVVEPVHGIPEVRAGDDVAELITRHAPALRDGDIVVVSSKIVSKAEGRLVPDADRAANAAGRLDAVRAETVRVVAERGMTQIVQTRHGFVMAAAGVDASNVPAGSVLLLPSDPDASARAIRRGLSDRLGLELGVVVTDTFGRPWRLGQTDLAIGAAGVQVFDDYRGRTDAHGNELAVTAPAQADELAAAAELVKGKVAQIPVAVIRGLAHLVTTDDGPGVRALVRPAEDDMFRLGSREAGREALRSPLPPQELADSPVDLDAVRRVVSLVTGDLDTSRSAWAIVEVDEAEVRKPLLDAVGLPSSVPYVALPYLRTQDPVERTAAVLDIGGIRDRLTLAARVDGLAARWLQACDVDLAAVLTLLPESDVEPLGLLAIGLPSPG
jgi:coenzyme F420-0:L-glutamate ligase/coenzyme F420-1:gamma-L-glutamate ligase